MTASPPYPSWIAYEPELVPPLELMALEGIEVLEEWFRWGEEWSVLLRVFAGLRRSSTVLEIGCGLGRIAFPLRYVLDGGRYDGFEIVRSKVDFLEATFARRHSNFHFVWANVRNTHYNPEGKIEADTYRFPYDDESFDVVFAASVFTHMQPANVAHYVRESARVLRRGGRCLFSFFLLDNYRPASERPRPFARSDFDFVDQPDAAEGFATAFPGDPERMTAYRLSLVQRMAGDAGLTLVRDQIPGYWSGAETGWVSAQDLLVLKHRDSGRTRRTASFR